MLAKFMVILLKHIKKVHKSVPFYMSLEILKFFKKLNDDMGITIVMITHEFDIAKYANRLIHIRDGKINYDGKIPKDDRNL